MKNVLLTTALTLGFAFVANVARADDTVESGIHAASSEEIEAARPAPDPAIKFEAPAPLPAPSLAPFEQTRMKSRGVFYGGLGTGAVGVVALAAGLMIQSSKPSCNSAQAAFFSGACVLEAEASGLHDAGKYALIVTGGAMIAGGIAMGIVGGWQVPLAPRASRVGSAEKPSARASLVVGPTSGSVRVVF